MNTSRSYYDFAVSLKKKYNEIKDLPEGSVSPSLYYIPWILMTTSEVYRRHYKKYDFNELLSVAFAASLEAEVNYNPEKNKFSTYARYHIIPALNEYVSNMSKTQLELQKRVLSFIDNYFIENNQYPTEDIIIDSLKISQETFRNLTQVVDIAYLDDTDAVNVNCPDATPEEALLLEEYFKALEYIDVDNQGILKMKIIDDLSFNLIQAKLNCSKDRVQKKYDKAVVELREELQRRGISKEDLVWSI